MLDHMILVHLCPALPLLLALFLLQNALVLCEPQIVNSATAGKHRLKNWKVNV
jgi:hypothetical protein